MGIQTKCLDMKIMKISGLQEVRSKTIQGVYSKGAKEKREITKKRKDKPIMGCSYIYQWVPKAPDYWHKMIKYRNI